MTTAAQTVPRRRVAALSGWAAANVPLVLLVVLVLTGVVFVDNFANTDNFVDILRSQSFLGVAAVGMTFVVMAGRFVDLSMPATIAISANIALAFHGDIWGTAVAVALLAALGIGLLNGVGVAILRINPVIATLGVGSIVAGLLLNHTGGAVSRAHSDSLGAFINGRPGGIPNTVIVLLVLVVVAQLVLVYTRFGGYLRLTGANEEAAAAAGVPTRLVTIAAFGCAGVAAGLTGVMIAGFSDQADIAVGTGYEFDALIAVVIGGTPLAGGRGSFARTLVGIAIVGTLNNIMLLLGLDSSSQLLVKGLVFVAIVAVDRVFARAEA